MNSDNFNTSTASDDVPMENLKKDETNPSSDVIITTLIHVTSSDPSDTTDDIVASVQDVTAYNTLLDDTSDIPAPRRRTLRNKARTVMRMDKKKSNLTLAEEWWQNKETVTITIPPFFMKWFFFFKYEEPPRHIKLLQQNAWAWRPRLNFWCVFPILIIFSTILIILGIPMLYSVHTQVLYVRSEYTFCTANENHSVLRMAILNMVEHTNMITKNESNMSTADCNPPANISFLLFNTCDDYLRSIPKCVRAASRLLSNCSCIVSLNVQKRMEYPIFLYYELNNFYVSHRRLIQSWDGYHYRGERHTATTRECYTYSRNHQGNVYFPCGMLPNSIFNDTISSINFNISRDLISFPLFRGAKFIDPNPTLKEQIISDTAPPPAWPSSIYDISNGIFNEDFIVWNYPSAFPNFRKMYARLDHSLDIGVYNFTINYNYLVSTIGATKFISLSTTSWIGGQPYGFIAYVYTCYGVLILICAFFLLVIHFPIKRRNTKNFLQQNY